MSSKVKTNYYALLLVVVFKGFPLNSWCFDIWDNDEVVKWKDGFSTANLASIAGAWELTKYIETK